MRADQRKFHYIYKITRTDGSGKFYVGMHSTDNLEDGYFGSGQRLWKSIKKHGKEKHSKEILEFLPSRKELKNRERELVNEELLGDKLCMNLRVGGEGGAQSHPDVLATISSKAKLRVGEKNSFFGKRHTQETKNKIAAKRQNTKTADVVKAKLRITSKKAASRSYVIIGPNAVIVEVCGLKDFCKVHGLVYSTMHSTIKSCRPTQEGWIVRRANVQPLSIHENGQQLI